MFEKNFSTSGCNIFLVNKNLTTCLKILIKKPTFVNLFLNNIFFFFNLTTLHHLISSPMENPSVRLISQVDIILRQQSGQPCGQ